MYENPLELALPIILRGPVVNGRRRERNGRGFNSAGETMLLEKGSAPGKTFLFAPVDPDKTPLVPDKTGQEPVRLSVVIPMAICI